MSAGRRMRFQLTPLLDLLLIIIFAQFMEVREATARTENTAEVEYRHRLAELEDSANRHKSQIDQEHAQRQKELNESFGRILEQQERSGDILSELFNVPRKMIEDALKLRDSSRAPTDDESEQLRKRLREFSKKRGRSVIRHLMTYDEIRKHCDVWELYIAENGTFQFSNGSVIREFRAQTPDEFEDRMYEVYKSFDQPKSLVVILFTFGDARAGIRQMGIDSMPNVVARMRKDRGERNWFEFAILGFSPDGPTLRDQLQRPAESTPQEKNTGPDQ
jgi:hypothetical protein